MGELCMLRNLERKKMVGTRGGSEVPLVDETLRLANIAENERKVRALIELKRNEALGGNKNPTKKATSSQPTKKRKKPNNCTTEVANGGRNLRSQSRLNQDGEDANKEPIGHGSDDIQANASANVQQKKKRRRGPTELRKIYDRDQPKQKVELNEYGQPVGSNGTTFANFIGTLVRKQLLVLVEDWRYIDPEAKLKLWDDIKSYFEVDEAALDYFMVAAAKKWREFKSDLKEKFDATLTDAELVERRDLRIKNDDWIQLIEQWRKPESEASSARNKKIRSNLKLLHVAGSKSFACVGHDMAQKLGYNPGRDKKIVEVHTSKKTGVPAPLAVPLIKKLQTEAALHPELEENSIEEGDLYAHVFGEKEPRGRVRMLGMGPTPQSVGAPGTKAKVPTKLAMQMQLRRRAEQAVSTLQEKMQAMERRVDDMQHIMFSQGSHSVEMPTPLPPNSVSRPVFSGIVPDDDDEEEEHEGHHDAVQEDDGLLIQKRIPSSHNVASTNLPPRSHVATPCVRQASQASHNQENLVGRDVILYHLVRSDPVAKAVVISTNQETIVGGEVLGLQYYEVLVNVVLKREVELARGYDGMQTMGDAHHMSIAWPSNRIKPCSKSRLSSAQSSGTNGRK